MSNVSLVTTTYIDFHEFKILQIFPDIRPLNVLPTLLISNQDMWQTLILLVLARSETLFTLRFFFASKSAKPLNAKITLNINFFHDGLIYAGCKFFS
jgi:hypothetical protein